MARVLAEKLGWEQIDSDQEVEREAGESIATIFQERGEAHFREIEANVISRLAELDRVVLSLGGGAVLEQSTRGELLCAGPVAWLTAAPGTIAQRLQEDPATEDQRPSLTGRGVIEEIEQVLADREPVYEACADVVVDTEGMTPDQVADEIMRRLGEGS